MDSKKLIGGLVLVMTCAAAATATAAGPPVDAVTHRPVPSAKRPVVKAATPAAVKPAAKPVTATSTTEAGAPKPAEVIGGLPWYHVTDGFALAKKEQKPVLVDVFTDWCGWCKVMDRQTFPNKAVKEVLGSKFILVKANAEDNADGQMLAQKYQVNGFPTTLFFEPSGKIVAGFGGFHPPDEFLVGVNEFLNLKRPIAEKKNTVSVHDSAPEGTTVSMPTENSAVIEGSKETQEVSPVNLPAH